MTSAKFRLLFVAILSVIFLILIGIMIAEQSIVGAIISLLASVFTVGYGFKIRAALKREGKL